MQDSSIPISQLVMGALWSLVGLLIAGAWVLGLMGAWNWSVLVGLTACATSAAAATAHVRVFGLRICALVREANTIPQPRNGSVSSMR